MARRSLPQRPDAFILTSTWPGPGSGRSNSLISTRAWPGRITPCINCTLLSPEPRTSLAGSFDAIPACAWSTRTLSLHRPRGEAPDHVAQGEHRDDELWDDGQHHSSGHG